MTRSPRRETVNDVLARVEEANDVAQCIADYRAEVSYESS